MKPPLVVAVEMGLGHLRAAHAVAQALGQPVWHADRPPLAIGSEQRTWARSRLLYEQTSRLSQVPGVGAPLRALLDTVTHIDHLHPARDLSAPTAATHLIQRLIARGLGSGLAARVRRDGVPLFTTYFTTALAADHHGCPDVRCLVTDSDLARAWVAPYPARSRIRYLAPSHRAVHRLLAYGVPPAHVELTGFPLPDELVGGPDLTHLRRHLRHRLPRLDPALRFTTAHRDDVARRLGTLEAHAPDGPRRPPLLVFAVGGAGAQAALAEQFLPSLRPLIEAGRLRVALLAGVRPAVAAAFHALAERLRLGAHPGLRVVVEPDLDRYFGVCNALLAEADILWTKPSEMTFFAALGLPLILSPPVGVQEAYNRRWALESGAALEQRDPRFAGDWLTEWLDSGVLAGAAWSGFTRLPARGLFRIVRGLGASVVSPRAERSPAAPSDGVTAIRWSGS